MRFGRGEVEPGTMFKRSKLHEKHNRPLQNHRDVNFKVYIFKVNQKHADISIRFVIKQHVSIDQPKGVRKWPSQSLFLISLNPL